MAQQSERERIKWWLRSGGRTEQERTICTRERDNKLMSMHDLWTLAFISFILTNVKRVGSPFLPASSCLVGGAFLSSIYVVTQNRPTRWQSCIALKLIETKLVAFKTRLRLCWWDSHLIILSPNQFMVGVGDNCNHLHFDGQIDDPT